MQSIPSKSDSTAGANGVLPASEYNDRNVEIEKVITRSGQTLSAAVTDQQSKAIFINAVGASSMIDSGSGDTITLNPVTGGSGLVPPDAYADFNGGVVCFNKATPNTGTAVTIAPWGLTAKALVRKDGSLPVAGDVIGECFAKWDNGADKWVLMRNETDTYKHYIDSSITFTPGFGKTLLEIDTTLGNRTVPFSDGVFIGQEIYVYTSGTGNSTMSGTGLYVNGIEQTSNTGILKIEWTGTEWRTENVVTADYVSGGVIVKQYSSGLAVFEFVSNNNGNDATTLTLVAIVHPFSLTKIRSVSHSGVRAKAGTGGASTYDNYTIGISDGTASMSGELGQTSGSISRISSIYDATNNYAVSVEKSGEY